MKLHSASEDTLYQKVGSFLSHFIFGLFFIFALLNFLSLSHLNVAASLFNYEPREFSSTPNSTPAYTPTYSPQPGDTPATPTTPTHQEVAYVDENPDYENVSDRADSPEMVIEKSYTPDLMRYADVDLTPQLGIIGVVCKNEKKKKKRNGT